jgi:cyclase
MKFRTNIFFISTIFNFIIIAIISPNCLTENIIRLTQKDTICQTTKAPGLGNPKVHKLTNDVYAVTGLYHSDGSVNAGIIFTEKSVIFIDSGMTIASGEFLWNIAQKRMKGNEDLYLILTHHHSDHTFGMRVMKDKGAKIIAHKIVKEELKNDNGFYKNFIIKACGWDKKKGDKILGDVVIYVPDQIIEKDTILHINSAKIHLLTTPGHVPDELSVYHAKSRTLFAGDTIYEIMLRPHVKFGGPDEWKLWISQLERLKQLDIETIVPGHGNLCSKKVINQNIFFLKKLTK